MTVLKPVSDAMRQLLANMGSTPAEFQAIRLTAGTKKQIAPKPTHAVQREKRDIANLEFEQNVARSRYEPTEVIVRRLAPERFKPEAYVIFIRHWHCVCGTRGTCQDSPYLFLRKRHVSDRNTKNYVPVRQIEFPHLPRLQEATFVRQDFCPQCLETPVWQDKTQANAEPASSTSADATTSSESVNAVSSPTSTAIPVFPELSTSDPQESTLSFDTPPAVSASIEFPHPPFQSPENIPLRNNLPTPGYASGESASVLPAVAED